MTDTPQELDASPATPRRRWVLAVIAVALLAAGVAFGLAIAAGRDDATPNQATTTAQLANVTQACTNWMMSTPTTATNASTWCNDMTAWMNQQLTSGQMMGSMMWGDPDRMLASCRSWTTTKPANTPAPSWCDGMVTWMRQHMNGGWDNWMMNGSMMGR